MEGISQHAKLTYLSNLQRIFPEFVPVIMQALLQGPAKLLICIEPRYEISLPH
jgi:hypothetical protein